MTVSRLCAAPPTIPPPAPHEIGTPPAAGETLDATKARVGYVCTQNRSISALRLVTYLIPLQLERDIIAFFHQIDTLPGLSHAAQAAAHTRQRQVLAQLAKLMDYRAQFARGDMQQTHAYNYAQVQTEMLRPLYFVRDFDFKNYDSKSNSTVCLIACLSSHAHARVVGINVPILRSFTIV